MRQRQYSALKPIFANDLRRAKKAFFIASGKEEFAKKVKKLNLVDLQHSYIVCWTQQHESKFSGW